jgi:hypothetical protein
MFHCTQVFVKHQNTCSAMRAGWRWGLGFVCVGLSDTGSCPAERAMRTRRGVGKDKTMPTTSANIGAKGTTSGDKHSGSTKNVASASKRFLRIRSSAPLRSATPPSCSGRLLTLARHVFHERCVLPCSNRANTCPYCRQRHGHDATWTVGAINLQS